MCAAVYDFLSCLLVSVLSSLRVVVGSVVIVLSSGLSVVRRLSALVFCVTGWLHLHAVGPRGNLRVSGASTGEHVTTDHAADDDPDQHADAARRQRGMTGRPR